MGDILTYLWFFVFCSLGTLIYLSGLIWGRLPYEVTFAEWTICIFDVLRGSLSLGGGSVFLFGR